MIFSGFVRAPGEGGQAVAQTVERQVRSVEPACGWPALYQALAKSRDRSNRAKQALFAAQILDTLHVARDGSSRGCCQFLATAQRDIAQDHGDLGG
jgi:hypothetical protein